jgi:hypothetical protein
MNDQPDPLAGLPRIEIPDDVLNADPPVNLWEWVRPKVAAALADALATGQDGRHE